MITAAPWLFWKSGQQQVQCFFKVQFIIRVHRKNGFLLDMGQRQVERLCVTQSRKLEQCGQCANSVDWQQRQGDLTRWKKHSISVESRCIGGRNSGVGLDVECTLWGWSNAGTKWREGPRASQDYRWDNSDVWGWMDNRSGECHVGRKNWNNYDMTSCGCDAGRNDHSQNSRDTIRNVLDRANRG